tara:strand:- start:655 stop:759 length:105 start_codon:yes stop_codon:yes gene_type:complete
MVLSEQATPQYFGEKGSGGEILGAAKEWGTHPYL